MDYFPAFIRDCYCFWGALVDKLRKKYFSVSLFKPVKSKADGPTHLFLYSDILCWSSNGRASSLKLGWDI